MIMTRARDRLGTILGVALALLAVGPSAARAQASVTAYTGQSCAGTRAGQNFACTSGNFSQLGPFAQPAPALTSCLAGSAIALDVVATVTRNGGTNRFDGAVFFGERGNDPSLNNPAQTCSLGVFPIAPAPFWNGDGDGVGDFQGNGSAPLTIRGVAATCAPATGSNVLRLPYILVFDNNNTPAVTYQTVTATGNNRCVENAQALVTGVVVQGWIRLTAQSVPAGDPQAFTVAASGSATPSPASASLSAGQTQTFQIPLSATGGTQTLRLDETAVAGWVSTAAITCTDPAGGSAASYVTVDGANRRITATLSAANYGAICTITNTKLARVTVREQSAGGTAAFTFGGTNGVPAAFTLDTTPSNPASGGPWAVTANGAAVTVTQNALAGWLLASASCTDGTITFGTLAGPTLTIAAADVTAGRNITCTFANDRNVPSLVMVKSASSPSVKPSDVVTFTLVVQNNGPGVATTVVLSDPISQYASWGVGSFVFTDGTPASGITLGTPAYSSDGGATWTFTPVSGGGGAPAGYDSRVTNWRIPMTGTMIAGRQFTLTFRTAVK